MTKKTVAAPEGGPPLRALAEAMIAQGEAVTALASFPHRPAPQTMVERVKKANEGIRAAAERVQAIDLDAAALERLGQLEAALDPGGAVASRFDAVEGRVEAAERHLQAQAKG